MNCIAIKAGKPERAGDVSRGMAAIAIRALGGAKVTVTFAACQTVDQMTVQGMITPALATNDAISMTEAGIVPPLLTL